MKRGEIYFLSIPTGTTTGYEIMYSRPAIVVSCDNLASSGNTVTVIPCSSSQRSKLRCHVDISSTGRDCRALVEQITTVDKERLGRYLGNVTPDELGRIDAALLNYLDLPYAENAGERETCGRKKQRSWTRIQCSPWLPWPLKESRHTLAA